MKGGRMGRKWTIVAAVTLAAGIGIFWGYHYLDFNQGSALQGRANLPEESSGPLTEEAKFGDETDFKDVGEFISEYHEWYNKKLGWGGIQSVKWSEQHQAASELSSVLNVIETEHEELQKDFDEVNKAAEQIVAGQKDKKLLEKLHRYFHDLDIEYNGYRNTNDYYDVTEFKRKP